MITQKKGLGKIMHLAHLNCAGMNIFQGLHCI